MELISEKSISGNKSKPLLEFSVCGLVCFYRSGYLVVFSVVAYFLLFRRRRLVAYIVPRWLLAGVTGVLFAWFNDCCIVVNTVVVMVGFD